MEYSSLSTVMIIAFAAKILVFFSYLYQRLESKVHNNAEDITTDVQQIGSDLAFELEATRSNQYRYSTTGTTISDSKDQSDSNTDTVLQSTNTQTSTNTNPVTKNQLRSVFIASAIPFIGFGFLDNFLMILAGDMIDATFCVTFGFSTMAAAALGNTISDVAGVFSGGIVEDIAARCGIEMPPLNQDQLRLQSVKMNQYVGQAFGIVVGCLLGMCPLLWIDPDANAKLKKEKERLDVLDSVVGDVTELLNAEATLMMMVDKDKGELHTIATEKIGEFRCPIDEGIMGHCVTTAKYINIAHLPDSEFYDAKRHQNYRDTGINIQSVLCMPVMSMAHSIDDGSGVQIQEVIAVVEVINKKSDSGFTARDEEILAAICSHVTVSLTDDDEKSFKSVIDMCRNQIRDRRQYATMNPVIEQRQIKLFETLMEETSSILNAESSQLLLIDPVKNVLRTKVAHKMPLREFDFKATAPQSSDIAAHVCVTGQLANVTDYQRSHFFNRAKQFSYLGNGQELRTALCVPLINTEHCVIGCIEVNNKKNNQMFSTDDIEMLMNIASHVSLTLEGEGSSIKKILALAEDQKKMLDKSHDFVKTKTLQSGPIIPDVVEDGVEEEWDDVDLEMDFSTTDSDHDPLSKNFNNFFKRTSSSRREQMKDLVKNMDLTLTLEKAEHLPIADLFGTIDPYITVGICEGDPLSVRYDGPTKGRGTTSPLGSGRSTTITQNQFPKWNNEKIKINLPQVIAEKPEILDRLYIHVKLWDWDFMKSDDIIGEFAYPLKRVVTEPAMESPRAFSLSPIRKEFQSDNFDLRKSRVYLKLTLGRKDKSKTEGQKKRKGDLASRAREQINKRAQESGGSSSDNFTDFPMHKLMSRDSD